VDEKPSADGLPPPGAANDTPAKRTRDTRAVPTDRTPGESREYPEIPGYEVLGICGRGGRENGGNIGGLSNEVTHATTLRNGDGGNRHGLDECRSPGRLDADARPQL
jgi:hypothetical protein